MRTKTYEGEEINQGELSLLTAAAHELKTPLTIISHLASTLEDPTLEMSFVERQQSLERIRMSADRTLRLIQSLTTSYRLSQPGQMSFELDLEPVNALQICEEAANELRPFASSQSQSIDVNFGRQAHLVVANRQLLHSVFFNLIDNAVRHNPQGTRVAVSALRQNDRVRVNIRDSGPGIRRQDFKELEARLGKHIQPLFGRSSGSGLGLFVAGQLVASMGGNLGLGRPTEGAEFRVELLRSRQLSLL